MRYNLLALILLLPGIAAADLRQQCEQLAKEDAEKVASSTFNKVCPGVEGLSGLIYKNNSPIRQNNDATSPIVRYAFNPTLIFVGKDPTKFNPVVVYDKKGKRIFTAPKWPCGKDCKTRYKADERTAQTQRVRKAAVENTGSPEGFFQVAPGLCFRVPDLGKCYNAKVREFCDGRIVQ